jgi:CBS domain-containing protein
MTEHAQFGGDSATTAAGKASGRRTEDVAYLGRLVVDLLGGEHVRHGLALATALGQMAAWERIVWTQSEFFRASLAWWSRAGDERATRPDRERPRSPRPREHPVRAVMRRRCAVVAQPDETVQAAVARMTEHACGSVLVCNGDRLCGLFTKRDLMTRVVGKGLDPRRTRLAEVMTRDPDRIESTATAREALRRMDGLIHPLPVVEDGRALGVLAPHDLPLETWAGMLPELEQRRALAERMR